TRNSSTAPPNNAIRAIARSRRGSRRKENVRAVGRPQLSGIALGAGSGVMARGMLRHALTDFDPRGTRCVGRPRREVGQYARAVNRDIAVDSLPRWGFASAGRLRNKLTGLALAGVKTGTASLRVEFDLDGEALPRP